MSVQSKNKDFMILYGSQTGQAEAISEEIFDRAHKFGFNCLRFCLSQTEKKFSIDKESCIVFVCSTTGEGEAPDTASKFVRRLKKKTLPSNFLANLTYSFLALGDSNYTNFCNCGKIIDARLQALGAEHFYNTGYADDAVGLELAVEPWIENLFPALKKHLGLTSIDLDIATLVQPQPNCADKPPGINQETDKKLTNSHGAEVKDLKDLKITMETTLKNSLPPLSTAALKIPSKSDAYLELKFLDNEESAPKASYSFMHPSAATDVYSVQICTARQLTDDSSVKKTLEIQLDTTNVEFEFQPGDSFGIVCNNMVEDVDYLITRLDIEDVANKKLTLTIKTDTKKKAPTIPEHIQLPTTLKDILSRDVDFRAVPRKAFLRMLVEYTDDTHEKRRLQELCSAQGGKDYTAFIREQNIGLVEILETFESCNPPIERILEFLPRLLPREYSVASSPLKSKHSMKFVFNVIEFPVFESNQRYGLCTKYLDDLTSHIRNDKSNNEITEQLAAMTVKCPKVNIYFRKPTNFRFPEDPSRPMILIGPGTGIAPFMGFLQQRECLKEQNPSLALGSAMLFYGCRYKEKDFLYRTEISRFLEMGILDHLYCSYSRDETEDPSHTKYVQENIKKHKADVIRLFVEEEGIVFICGDAKHMGRDVTNTFVELIEEYKGLDKIEAVKYLDSLRKQKRFLEDVWT